MKEKIKRFELVISDKQYTDLQAIAAKEYRSVTAVIKVLIDKRIKEDVDDR